MRYTFPFANYLASALLFAVLWTAGLSAAPITPIHAGDPPIGANIPCPSFTGPIVSCVNGLETYLTQPVAGSSYSWTVSSGGVLSNTTGPSTLVNWVDDGPQFVVLTTTGVGASVCTLYVNVSPQPTPFIQTDFVSDCPEERKEGQAAVIPPQHEDKEECWVVCENTTVNYWTTPVAGNTYSWVIVGGTPTTATGPNVTVTWGPSGTGSVILTETAPGGCSETVEECVKIIDSPIADIWVNGQPYSGAINICLGETVYFDDKSIGASYWYWDFGDGATSTLQDASHEYTTAGTFFGTLTVKNECGCTASFRFEVIVNNLAAPEIGCISTVCLKDCAFYSVTNMGGCPGGSVDWKVYGGALMGSANNDNVQVVWDDNDGFIQQNGYGLICVTVTNCPTLCDGTVCVQVPVIHQVKISGPTVVCQGDPVTFSVPIQPGINEPYGNPADGVDFDWILASGGTIISQAPYSNSITVVWNNPGNYTVDLDVYENYLTHSDCKFDPAPINITVKPTFTVTPETAVMCVGSSQGFTAVGPGTSTSMFTWTVTGPGGTSTTNTGHTFGITPIQAGTYVVTAQSTTGQYCDVEPAAVVTVLPAPPTPTGSLTGQLSVCLNSPYTYTLNTAPPSGTVLVWSINGGTLYGAAGQTVTAQWTGGAMTLSVQAMSTVAPFCLSAPLTFNISQYVPPANFVTVTNPATACVNETKTNFVGISAALMNYTNLQWNIQPSTAASVVAGQNTPSPSILFNTSAPPNVTISCTATVCGGLVTSQVVVSVTQIPTYTINVSPNPVCQGDNAVLSVSPGGVGSYSWNFGDATPVSTSPSPSHAWASTGTFPVTAQLTLSICGGAIVNAATTVNVLPDPVVNVTASNGYILCPPNYPASTNLVASAQFACTYLWSTLQTGNTINVTAPGTYTVVATSIATGCTASSSVTVLGCNSCDSVCLTTTTPWTFTSVENCDQYTFTPVIGSSTATFVSWNFGDGTPLNTTAGMASVPHTYDHPGYYYVRLRTYDPVSGCYMTYQQQITVKFKGDFSYTFNCSGTGGVMQTILTDRSEYLPGVTAVKTWYKVGFGPIGTGNPLTTTLGPGSHNIYLSVLINGTQTCVTPTQTVVVPGLPVASFNSNAPKCEGVPILFSNTSTGGSLGFSWSFGDGATSGLTAPSRTYLAPPTTYTVTLTANSAWGCSSTATSTLTVYNSGTPPTTSVVPASGQQCQGLPITITALPGALPTPINYAWYNSTAPGVLPLGTANSFVPSVSGTYGVIVTDNNGCPYNVLAAPIVYLPPPVVQIVGNTDYCLNEIIQLTAQLGNNPGYTYSWTINTPTGTINLSGASVNVNSAIYGAGPYTFNVTITHTASTCTNSGSLAVNVHPGVQNLTITSNNACDPATLTAFGVNAVTYNWSNGTNAPSTVVNQGGYYSVIASDANGCTAEESYYLDGKPDLSNIMVGCYDYCEPVTWQAINCYGCTYQWYENGSPITGANGATYDITTSGVYTVVVTNSQGCSSTSDPINISISNNPEVCNQCNVNIGDEITFECVGIDPSTGLPIYQFSMPAINSGGALYGVSAVSDMGNVVITSPSTGYLPGSATTTITGYLYWNGQQSGCIWFTGYLTEDCSSVSKCDFKWCGELPKCCDKPCALKDFGSSAVCIGNGLYQVYVALQNDGCTLFNAFVKHGNTGNVYALNPGTIIPGGVMYSFVAQGQPGSNGFVVCGYKFNGEKCCLEFKVDFPECPQTHCGLEAGIVLVECIGKDQNSNPIFQFSGTVYGAPSNATFYIVSNPGYVTNLTWSYVSSGNYYNLSGTYVSGGAGTLACFTVVAVGGGNEPVVCSGEGCVDVPHCQGNKPSMGRSDDINHGSVLLSKAEVFSMAPNPATGHVKVFANDATQQFTQIRVIDMMGKVQIQVTPTHSITELNIASLPSGLYSLVVIDPTGNAHSKKLVVLTQEK